MAGLENDQGVVTIDTGLLNHQHIAAAYLIHADGHAAFIDCGTSWAVPRLLAALKQQRLTVAQVDWLIVTHIHLDHAGGASALLDQLPNARLLVHPRGAAHMIDPTRLVAGATAVYGEQLMRRNFGSLAAIDPDRVVSGADQQVVDIGGRQLRLLDTPGHASHHFCIVDEQGQGIFTGDTLGLSYRALDSANGAFVFPTTTPVQFDPDALRRSIDYVMAQQPRRLYLTHYGEIAASPDIAADLQRRVSDLADIAIAAESLTTDREQHIRAELEKYLLAELRDHGCPRSPTEVADIMGMDLSLNAQGLEVWLQRRAKRQQGWSRP